MSWTPLTIRWVDAAIRDLRGLDRPVLARVRAAVNRYAATGYGDVKRLQDVVQVEYRLRVGDWRVRFALDDAAAAMVVQRVLPRGSAYR